MWRYVNEFENGCFNAFVAMCSHLITLFYGNHVDFYCDTFLFQKYVFLSHIINKINRLGFGQKTKKVG